MVFGLFGNKVERLKKAACQRYGQHDPRRDAMARLLQMGSLEAYRAVLSRFTVNCDSPHWDEKEKTWLAARLLERAVIILVALQFEIEPVAIDLFQRQQALFGDRPMAVGE